MLKVFLLIFYAAVSQCNADRDDLQEGGYKDFTIKQHSFVFHKDEATWQQAKERCAGAGAELWVPADRGEQQAVRAVGSGTVWTGINDRDNKGSYESSDGRPLSIDHFKWRASEPNTGDGSGRWPCAALWHDSSLYFAGCNFTRRYVCKFPAPSTTPPPLATTPPSGHHIDDLPEGGYRFTIQQDSYVYYKDWVTWEQAKERCAGAGAELWAPADGGEQRAVRGELDRFDVPYVYAVWTGIKDVDDSGSYMTVEGRPLNMADYGLAASGPGARAGTARCVVLLARSSLQVYRCNALRRYLCKLPTAPPAHPSLIK